MEYDDLYDESPYEEKQAPRRGGTMSNIRGVLLICLSILAGAVALGYFGIIQEQYVVSSNGNFVSIFDRKSKGLNICNMGNCRLLTPSFESSGAMMAHHRGSNEPSFGQRLLGTFSSHNQHAGPAMPPQIAEQQRMMQQHGMQQHGMQPHQMAMNPQMMEQQRMLQQQRMMEQQRLMQQQQMTPQQMAMNPQMMRTQMINQAPQTPVIPPPAPTITPAPAVAPAAEAPAAEAPAAEAPAAEAPAADEPAAEAPAAEEPAAEEAATEEPAAEAPAEGEKAAAEETPAEGNEEAAPV